MITLTILNFILDLATNLATHIFGNLLQPMTSLSQYIQAFYIPQTILDIYANVCYFLPIGTIAILFALTALIVTAKIIMSLCHFLPGLIFG